jgi:hypothetical protein
MVHLLPSANGLGTESIVLARVLNKEYGRDQYR